MSDIPMFDYLTQYRSLRADLLAGLETVIESGRLILGEQGQRFERSFADYLGGQVSTVGVNSGTDALVVILMAMGIGPGDEVITVANTAVPTVSAIRMVGATPVFCDVSLHTALMDLDALPALITERTRAVIAVHLFGNMVDIPRLRSLVADRGVRVIEDCAQCHGATLNGAMAGTLGDASAFSFYPTKNLGAYGDAGLAASPDAALVKDMKRIRMYGFDGSYYAEREGINTRLDEMQAAVLNIKLPHLVAAVERRRAIAERYNNGLSARIERVVANTGVRHAHHLYVVRVSARDHIKTALAAQGIATGIHYPHPIHLMRGYHFLGYRPGSLPRTESLAQELLSLPMYPELADAAVDRVIEAINSAVD
ncbi:MAG: DegT/DnrJ/EryC1/StrS family aminotransferase [Hydrogenophaga sp.]|jgi:dTDP-4-amino-4,6-dideoxygalactose transaminase|uniref:DegT/DnrJ/EryC1/StrS family aminotransferase n=1 Tax=Hydrogenophaga sp. TaxID=1904254 RepID=UPI002730A801|nr:DegT/DnrJ/EryC1/StrS family aminotransferase [Hydrogenophaga sp.]MDP2407468.1 DegT/DnrJ/EryC1/StrS family aminotransferase [Hydrogenophaga sp.]MDZ4177358.1 DegT/DnrJ/EryC1/StrS family aminotransferase [Hydrogenophaga sp.]